MQPSELPITVTSQRSAYCFSAITLLLRILSILRRHSWMLFLSPDRRLTGRTLRSEGGKSRDRRNACRFETRASLGPYSSLTNIKRVRATTLTEKGQSSDLGLGGPVVTTSPDSRSGTATVVSVERRKMPYRAPVQWPSILVMRAKSRRATKAPGLDAKQRGQKVGGRAAAAQVPSANSSRAPAPTSRFPGTARGKSGWPGKESPALERCNHATWMKPFEDAPWLCYERTEPASKVSQLSSVAPGDSDDEGGGDGLFSMTSTTLAQAPGSRDELYLTLLRLKIPRLEFRMLAIAEQHASKDLCVPCVSNHELLCWKAAKRCRFRRPSDRSYSPSDDIFFSGFPLGRHSPVSSARLLGKLIKIF